MYRTRVIKTFFLINYFYTVFYNSLKRNKRLFYKKKANISTNLKRKEGTTPLSISIIKHY